MGHARYDTTTQPIQTLADCNHYTATGGIVRTMTRDLLIDPTTRGVKDIKHVIVAAASSSSKKSAESFVADCVTPTQGSEIECKAYGSYEELVKDPNVDVRFRFGVCED